MKALSFRQPWAELVIQGRKTMDLRTYTTHYRGRIAVHVAQTVERDDCWAHDLDPDQIETGGVIGIVAMVEVVPLTEADYERHRSDHLASRHYREGLYGLGSGPARAPTAATSG